MHMPKAIITGALGGIGRALCDKFMDLGYTVIAVDQRAGNIPNALMFQFDLAQLPENTPERERFLREVATVCKGSLDVLINNAAIQHIKKVEEIGSSDWFITLRTNLLAPFFLIQHFLEALRKARGNVVNISSIHATHSKPGFVTYATSKGALLTLTKALALELAPEVRVNAILPAATDTPMLRAGFDGGAELLNQLGRFHPIRRIAEPAEIATVAAFLASPAASYVTGTAVPVDGGIGARLHDPA
jgi:NAD(P)-dependent dehydrogenase (short-subunit alcohol dehydrogenase family)